VVNEDGRAVLQSINGGPTFFVSPREFMNVTIRGKFIVETSEDDDLIGFVVGYRSPLNTSVNPSDTFDFLLFDWKQTSQTYNDWPAPEGFTLARVQGTIFPEGVHYPALWKHEGAGVEVLASDYGVDRGWQDRTEHAFSVTYTPNRVLIAIDGEIIFNIEDTFYPGRFGFYNYSQESVRYFDFSYVEETLPSAAKVLFLREGDPVT
jgi:hypothetical protein